MQIRNKESSLRLLIALALLCSISIILGKFLAFNITEFMRFSLENLPIFIAAIAFGPLAGAITGLVSDIIGCLLAAYMLNPLITLGAVVNGLLAGLIYKALSKFASPVKITSAVILSHLIGSVIIKSIGLVVYYDLPFLVTFGWRSLNYLIVGIIESILLCYLFKSKVLLSNIQKIQQFSQSSKKESSDELQ